LAIEGFKYHLRLDGISNFVLATSFNYSFQPEDNIVASSKSPRHNNRLMWIAISKSFGQSQIERFGGTV